MEVEILLVEFFPGIGIQNPNTGPTTDQVYGSLHMQGTKQLKGVGGFFRSHLFIQMLWPQSLLSALSLPRALQEESAVRQEWLGALGSQYSSVSVCTAALCK